MAINHLERRGFENGPAVKVGERVTGRRSRKFHKCASKDCPLQGEIEFDEVYVEHALTNHQFYTGTAKRYHLGCAEVAEIIVRVDRDATNKRRQAILMAKAKRANGSG